VRGLEDYFASDTAPVAKRKEIHPQA